MTHRRRTGHITTDSDDAATRANIRAAADLLLKVSALRDEIGSRPAPEAIEYLNLVQFSLLWQLDLSCFLDELRIRRQGWKRKLIARQLAILLFECTDDFTELLGGRLRQVFSSSPAWGVLEPGLRRIHGKLTSIHKRHRVVLAEIRNYTAAHRDHDAARQIEIIKALDSDAIHELGFELYQWTTELLAWLSTLSDQYPWARMPRDEGERTHG